MNNYIGMLGLSTVLLVLSGCDSNDNDTADSDAGDEPVVEAMIGIDAVAAADANAEPVQIEPVSLQTELDALSVNGRNGEPVPVQPGDTVESILARLKNQ